MTSEEIKSWFYGEVSADRQAEMEQWFIANINSPVLDEALTEILKTCSKADKERTMLAFHDICHRLGLTPPKHYRLQTIRRMALGAAAALIAGIVIGSSFTLRDQPRQSTPQWVQIYSGTGTTNTVVLPDSSTLRLSPASVLIYDETSFYACREVYLHGGAYAEITADSEHPFIIRSEDASVTVLGTRFDFSNYAEDNEMEVKLYEGKVALLANYAERSDTLNLIPGEVVKVDKRTGDHHILGIRGLDGYSSGSFHFINKELRDIANELERHFVANIFIESEELRSRKFYAIFANNESLDQILDGLNASGQMEIRHLDNNIVIIR